MTAAPVSLLRLRKRSEFLRVAASGHKIVTTTMVIQAAHSSPASPPDSIRVGFTVTKRCGNAVVRNRIKRRMRALAQEIIPVQGQPGTDYVLIGRESAHAAEFTVLQRDLGYALRKILEKMQPKPENQKEAPSC